MKIVVVDNHPVVRQGVIAILANEKGIEEIKEASSLEEAMKIMTKEDIGIAVVDLKFSREDGLDIVERAKEIGLKTKFVILTSFISQENFKRAEQLGVDGYILKDAFVEDILYAISVINRGKKYYYPEVLRINNQLNNNEIDQLTNREKDVLKELAKGLNNEEIARNLYISEHTVKKHVSSILSKLNLRNRSQIAYKINNKSNI